jgi:hypothetical protein
MPISTESVIVIPHEDRWRVTGDDRRTGKSFPSRESALEAAREVAQRLGVELVICDSDGRVRRREKTFLRLQGLP